MVYMGQEHRVIIVLYAVTEMIDIVKVGGQFEIVDFFKYKM